MSKNVFEKKLKWGDRYCAIHDKIDCMINDCMLEHVKRTGLFDGEPVPKLYVSVKEVKEDE